MPLDQMTDVQRQAWSTLNDLTGEPGFVEVFANTPELLSFVMEDFYGRIFFGGRVAQHYKQLLRLKLSRLHGCRTCNKQNVPGALEAGISQAQVDAIDDHGNGPFSDAEKAVLDYAELISMSNADRTLAAADYERLQAHFSDAEICELGVVGAFVTGFAKLSFVLDLVEKEPYCSFR
ncbi:MAG: carboxymuconolactone decarboxylase family protein [Pseudomonadota bacterium]